MEMFDNKIGKFILAFGLMIWVSLFFGGLVKYQGSPFCFTVFSMVFLIFLFSGFVRFVSYGYFFSVIFVWLGFWFKLVAHLILDYGYADAIGAFQNTGDAWDTVLIIASFAVLGIMLARVAFGFVVKRTIKNYEEMLPPIWYLKFRGKIWIATIVFTILLVCFNSFFGIHQLSLYPKTIFLWPINWMTAWFLNIGVMIVFLTLISWDVRAKKNIFLPGIAIIGEAFLSTVSIFSRGTFFYKIFPFFIVLLKDRIKLSLSRTKMGMLIFICGLSFVLAVGIVGELRKTYYSSGNVSKSAEIKHEKNQKFKFVAEKFVRENMIKQFSILVVDRWVGLEGIMAVSAYDGKGIELLINGLLEKRKLGVVPLYDKICNSEYLKRNKEKYQFATIPGGVGFFYYSGSVGIMMLSLFFLSLLVFSFEKLIGYLTCNEFLISLIGMMCGNVIAQFGAGPIQAIYSFIMILVVSVFIWGIDKKRIDFKFIKEKIFRVKK